MWVATACQHSSLSKRQSRMEEVWQTVTRYRPKTSPWALVANELMKFQPMNGRLTQKKKHLRKRLYEALRTKGVMKHIWQKKLCAWLHNLRNKIQRDQHLPKLLPTLQAQAPPWRVSPMKVMKFEMNHSVPSKERVLCCFTWNDQGYGGGFRPAFQWLLQH